MSSERDFDVTLKDKKDVIVYAKKLQEQGQEMFWYLWQVYGAVLFAEDVLYMKAKLQRKVVNSVGAGDSMVAGFLYGY